MKERPSDSYFKPKTTLKPMTAKERTLYAMYYKQCCSKAILFMFIEGAGSTKCKPEYAYESKWKDENMNIYARKVDRPNVTYLDFSRSNSLISSTRQDSLS